MLNLLLCHLCYFLLIKSYDTSLSTIQIQFRLLNYLSPNKVKLLNSSGDIKMTVNNGYLLPLTPRNLFIPTLDSQLHENLMQRKSQGLLAGKSQLSFLNTHTHTHTHVPGNMGTLPPNTCCNHSSTTCQLRATLHVSCKNLTIKNLARSYGYINYSDA
jgi:hypothetical protein